MDSTPLVESSIPVRCTEETVSDFRQEDNLTWLKKTRCVQLEVVMGERFYGEGDVLLMRSTGR